MSMRYAGVLVLLLLLPVLVACQSTAQGQADLGAPESPVIMRVGGQQFTVADFSQRLTRDIGPAIEGLLAQGQTPAEIEQLAVEAEIRAQIFDQMLQDALLSRYARQHGIGVDASAIDAEVFSLIQPTEGSPFLVTTDARLRSAQSQLSFEVVARQTQAPMVRTRLMLVPDEAQAEEVLALLAAGGDFYALAGERGLDIGAPMNDAAITWVPTGNFPPEIDSVVFSAPLQTPGKVSTTSGVYVFEVLERAEQRPFDSFEMLRSSQNAQVFYEQSFAPWYEALLLDAQASGDLQIAENFDPNMVPLPFPQ
ncbi:peptidylprolyl isomerase [Candidatus Chloroploca asiatica]|nr:SurA N-terminal domain-containing protein [Candidatus Chloroploca asiatica]